MVEAKLMRVIKEFRAEDSNWIFENLAPIKNGMDGLLMKASGEEGTAISPIISASLLVRYEAINIEPVQSLLKAKVYSPEDESFIQYNQDTETWDLVNKEEVEIFTEQIIPSYTDDELITFLSHWYKPFRLKIIVPPNCYLQQIRVSLDVAVSLEDYLLDFAVVKHLTRSVRYTYVSYLHSTSPGSSIFSLPEGIESDRISNIEIRKVGSNSFYTIDSMTKNQVIVKEVDSCPILVSFDFIPFVQVIPRGSSYQLTSLPAITIKRIEESNIRKDYSREWVSLDTTKRDKIVEMRTFQTYDLKLEIAFVAFNKQICQKMYEAILSFTESIPLLVEPIGEHFGLYWGNTIAREGKLETKPIIDLLSTIVVNCQIKSISINN